MRFRSESHDVLANEKDFLVYILVNFCLCIDLFNNFLIFFITLDLGNEDLSC